MIRNTKQYRTTKAQAAKFALALAEFDQSSTLAHPKLSQAQREAIASQLESLQQELAEYERLRKTRLSHQSS